MAEFISTFTTGFSEIVKENLPKQLEGIKIINISDGLVHYQFNGNSRDLEKIIYFNNTFFVLKAVKDKNIDFSRFVSIVSKAKQYYLINKGAFRIRFIQENQFAKVDKNITRRAEEIVLKNSKLKIDRLSPDTEIWYSIRRDGFAFCGQLISKRTFTEKNLNKGELRPEVAYLMCVFADIGDEKVIAEPFCGYGAIPVQLIKNFNKNIKQLFVSDIDEEKIEHLKQKSIIQNYQNIKIKKANAFDLTEISEKSIDVVITDPPWGYYEDIGDIKDFYTKMFNSFRRILKDDGYAVILSARKEELTQVCEQMNLNIKKDLHTLVNGKKAGLYLVSFN